MTLENFNYRTDPLFLRNQFSAHADKYGIPIIPKSKFVNYELQDLRLLRFDQVKKDNGAHANRMVHFFLYDYLFESLWKNPEPFVEDLSKYLGVMTPDFSMYIEMPAAVQLYNTFRNRWCGAYLKTKGLRVVPTINWGTEESFDFCFAGVPKGSAVAVSTYMFHAHNNHAEQKDLFMRGYQEMLRQIEPEHIICYSEPFKEMTGNIIYVDYDLSSWKHMNDDIVKDSGIKHIIGYTSCLNKPVITKTGFVMKGGGSAYGGEWRPKDEDDERLVGKPGEIKESTHDGYKTLTKIGESGYAERERHFTDHNNSNKRTDPHDHIITWEDNHPNFSKPINYEDEKVPEFKNHLTDQEVNKTMSKIYSNDSNKFETIDEFKKSVLWGCEVEFIYRGKFYGITRLEVNNINLYSPKENGFEGIDIMLPSIDALLDYEIDGARIRDIILDAEITGRNL
ncbi:MAG: DUF4417 domain-containing protein [Ruminococcus sp.]|nr:DUF4417 domain-containing protein [Ruminococcus sp.]